jgi:hypothetical protein
MLRAAIVIMLVGAAPASAGPTAIVWPEPASADALSRAGSVREIARDFMWITYHYPVEVDGTVVLGFCPEDDAPTALAMLQLIEPALTTRTDLARPDSIPSQAIDCPDGTGVTVARTETIKRGKLTLTVVALVIAAPATKGFVQGDRVTYHAFLRKAGRLLDHWVGGYDDFLGDEAPSLVATTRSVYVTEPCHYQTTLHGGRARTELSIRKTKIGRDKSVVDDGCAPVEVGN